MGKVFQGRDTRCVFNYKIWNSLDLQFTYVKRLSFSIEENILNIFQLMLRLNLTNRQLSKKRQGDFINQTNKLTQACIFSNPKLYLLSANLIISPRHMYFFGQIEIIQV